MKFELADEGGDRSHAVEFLTPALGELVVFFGSLFFFLLSRNRQRQYLVLMFEGKGRGSARCGF